MRKCFASLIGESGLFPQSLYVLCICIIYYIFLRQQLPDYSELFVLWIACITSYSETNVCVLLVLCTCVAVKECALFAIVR